MDALVKIIRKDRQRSRRSQWRRASLINVHPNDIDRLLTAVYGEGVTEHYRTQGHQKRIIWLVGIVSTPPALLKKYEQKLNLSILLVKSEIKRLAAELRAANVAYKSYKQAA